MVREGTVKYVTRCLLLGPRRHSHERGAPPTMSDIPEGGISGQSPTFRCLLCGRKGLRAKNTRENPCPENKHGHVWVHQVHLDNHRLGKRVPDHARRLFETYPQAMELRFVEDAAASSIPEAKPGSAPRATR